MRGLLILLFIIIAGWGFHAQAQVSSDTAFVNFLMRQSDTLRLNKKFELAQEKLREAIRVFDERKIDKPATRTYLIRQIGGLYLDQGDYDAALRSFEEALDYARTQFSETDRNVIRTYLDLGIAWYYLGNFDRALLNYEYAENLILKSYDENKDLLANCYNNIGICSYFKHNYKKALNYYKKALEIAEAKEAGKPSTRIASMYNNIGICYKYLQDYNQAINYYNKALAIKRLHRPDGHPDLVPNYNNLGTCYLSLNQNEKALGYFLKSEKILLESLGNDNPKLAPVFNNLGNTYIELGDYQKGREYLRKAIGLHRKVYKNEFHPEIGRIYINLGNSYFEQRQYDAALREFQAAYEYFLPKEHEYPTLLAEAYYKAGQVYGRKKEYDTALAFMDKALGKLHYSDTDFEHLERNISPMDLLTALSLKARTLVEYYTDKNDPRRLHEAEAIFKQAILVLEYLKASFREAGSKQILLDKSFSTYEGAIAVCHQLYQLSEDPRYLEQAFEYAEQSNSILLQEAVQKTNAERFANLPDSLLDKEHNLKVDIAFFESKRFNEEQKRDAADPQAINTYNSKIFDLKKQYFALLKTFETQYPEYYALRYASNSVSVETIQKELLKPNEALVEYFVGDDHIFAFVITPDTFALEYIPKILPVEAWVEEFRNSIVQYNPLREDIRFLNQKYVNLAHELYELLFAPIEPVVRGRDLTIVPGGILGYLPFEALLTQAPDVAENYRTHPYLIKAHTISYNYSAVLLRDKMLSTAAAPTNDFLGIAPRFDDVVNVQPAGSRTYELGALNYNIPEVQNIYALMGGTLFLDSMATEANFREQAGQYNIIHLATHGKANDESSDYSFLAFYEIKDNIENELLYVKDLYNLHLPAEMVVLSACETGVGELKRGEGIISLARGFFYAGVQSIITTLWSIDDRPTAEIMTGFYKNLRKDLPKSEALRQAKLEYISSQTGDAKAHPRYWAGFVPVGNMAPLKTIESRPWFFWAAGGLGLAILLFFWRKNNWKDATALPE